MKMNWTTLLILFTVALVALLIVSEILRMDESPCTRYKPVANDILDCQATRLAATAIAGDK